jgi:hypothetical protein
LVASFISPASASVKITINNINAAGVGFNDPTPATPVGGNNGTTLGQQRLNAFKEAARIWGETLDSPVEIIINARFTALSCNATSAVLGSAGTTSVFGDIPGQTLLFPGTEFVDTWYHSALADKVTGVDVNPGAADISANFNVNLGNPGCLTGSFWYLGLDGKAPAGTIDLVTVLLHEFAHGLGFSQFASVTNGSLFFGFPDVYNRQIFDDTLQNTWDQMTDAQRVASAINPRRVVFIGNNVTEALPGVLALGVPGLSVSGPPLIAGHYEVGTASFGPALTSSGVTGQIVLAQDAANAAGPSTTDACTAISNAGDVAGKIALVDRGTCGFVVKAANVQAAGAIAMIVADNAPGGPPAGLGGTDPTITIPAVRITLPDGALIKAQLATGVFGTLSLDMSMRAGADVNDKALLYTPSPVAPGSTISHYDTIDFPNQLMEPNINADLTHNVKPPADLTLPLLRDVGWFPDADNDGLADNSDECVNSNLTAGNIKVGSCDTTVPNTLFTNGCTIIDYMNLAASGVKNHGGLASNTAQLGNALYDAGIITLTQKDRFQACVVKKK